MGQPTGYWQCTPYNCGSASIWDMPYSYDLAGDVYSWTHPAGFTITNSIDVAYRGLWPQPNMTGGSCRAGVGPGLGRISHHAGTVLGGCRNGGAEPRPSNSVVRNLA